MGLLGVVEALYWAVLSVSTITILLQERTLTLEDKKRHMVGVETRNRRFALPIALPTDFV